MLIIKKISHLQKYLSQQKNGTITLVPTMGALHEGHLSLIKLAQKKSGLTLVSIFVNPTQFNNREDYLKYPHTLTQDLKLAKKGGADVVFAPDLSEIYPHGIDKNSFSITINSNLTELLEGKFRPGHFQGVTTIVGILFNLINPDFAIFGEKDYQQLLVIKELVKFAGYKTKIIKAPIIREKDKLALSSRNRRLDAKARRLAVEIPKTLFKLKRMYREGERDLLKLEKLGIRELKRSGIKKIDYLKITNDKLLAPKRNDKNIRVLVACYIGKVRLIDNVEM